MNTEGVFGKAVNLYTKGITKFAKTFKGKDLSPRTMSPERLKTRKMIVDTVFDIVGTILHKKIKNPDFSKCFTKDERSIPKWEQGKGKYVGFLYYTKKRFKGTDAEWNECYKEFRKEMSSHRNDVRGFTIGFAQGSNSTDGWIEITDHSKLWRPANEVFVTQEDYSLMGSSPKKKIHRKVVSRHAMNGKNEVKIVSQEQQYPDWF